MLDNYTVTPITEDEPAAMGETEELSGYTVEPYVDEDSSPSDPVDTRPSRDPLVTRSLRESGDLDNAMELTGNDLAYSLEVTKGLDPKTAKRVAAAAESSKLPRDTIERNLGQVERNLADKQILSTLTQTKKDGSLAHPKTAAFLSDSKRMSIGRDEVARLAAIEKIIANEDREDNSALEDFGSQLKKGFLVGASKVAMVPGHVQDMSKNALLNLVAGTTSNAALKQFAENYDPMASTELLNNPVAKHLGEAAESIQINATKESAIDQLSDGEILKGTYNIFMQATESAPLMLGMAAATMAGVSPTVTLSAMGEIEAAGSYQEGLARGKTPSKAMTASVIKGGAEAAFEVVTLGMMTKMLRKQTTELVKRFGKETTKQIIARSAKTMGGGFAEEGAAEAATTGVQTLADYLTGETDALDGVGKNMLNSFLVGGMTGFGMSSVSAIQETTLLSKYHSEKAAQDKKIRQQLEKESDAPEILEAALDNNFEGEEISISPERLEEESFNQSKHRDLEGNLDQEAADEELRVTLEDLGIQDQIAEAKATGKDIKVKRSKWLVKYANTDFGKALESDIKYGIDGLSAKEIDAAKEDVVKNLKEMQKETDAIEKAKEIHPKIQAYRDHLVKNTDFNAEYVDSVVDMTLKGGYALASRQGETLDQWIDRVNLVAEVDGQRSAEERGFESELDQVGEPLKIEDLPEEGRIEAEEFITSEIIRMAQEVGRAEVETGLHDTTQRTKNRSYSNTFPTWYRELGVKNKAHLEKVIKSGKGKVYDRIRAKAVSHLLEGVQSAQEQHFPSEEFRMLLNYPSIDKGESFEQRDEAGIDLKRNESSMFSHYPYTEVTRVGLKSVDKALAKDSEVNIDKVLEEALALVKDKTFKNEATGEQVVISESSMVNFISLVNSRLKSGERSSAKYRDSLTALLNIGNLFQVAKPTAVSDDMVVRFNAVGKTEGSEVFVDFKVIEGVVVSFDNISRKLPADSSEAPLDGKAFDPSQAADKVSVSHFAKGITSGIKNPETFFQEQVINKLNLDSLGFYSKLAQEVGKMDFKAAPAKDVASRLRKTEGIKKEELEATGILDMLEGLGPKTKITKAEILTFLEAGGIQLEEVTLGEGVPTLHQYVSNKGYSPRELMRSNRELHEEIKAEYKDKYGDGNLYSSDSDTKYQEYTLPGGTNYREIVMTLPGIGYESSHFDGTKDYLAHLRVKDFTTADGKKTLLIEEIQSDLHQEGRKKGYVKSPEELQQLAKEIDALETEGNKLAVQREKLIKESNLNKIINKISKLDEKLYDVFEDIDAEMPFEAIAQDPIQAEKDYPGIRKAAKQFEKIEGQIADLKKEQRETYASVVKDIDTKIDVNDRARAELRAQGQGVANAPFKNTEAWSMLVFKRALAMAAEGGYDSVSWTPGEAQAERYDLSRKVKNIAYQPVEGGYLLHAIDMSGNKLDVPNKVLSPSEMGDIIGKELVEKIEAGEGTDWSHKDIPGKMLEGEDLKIGGEGMKAFYDKMLPKAVGKYVKKLDKGAKVGTTRIGESPTKHVVRLTTDPTTFLENVKKYAEETPNRTFMKDTIERDVKTLNDAIKDLEGMSKEQMDEYLTDRYDNDPEDGALYHRLVNVPGVEGRSEAIPFVRPEVQDALQKIEDWEGEGTLYHLQYLNPEKGSEFILDVGPDAEGPRYEAYKNMYDVQDGDHSKLYNDYKELNDSFSEGDNSPEVWNLPITEKLRDKVTAGQPLFQAEGNDPNASITFKEHETLIQLFKTANKSSLLHETGHLFLKEMQRIVDAGKGDAQVVKDLNTLRQFADGKFDVEGIEKVVRGFEKYLMEGKAPSVELQDSFSRFKGWLKAIYETLKGNNLLPDINDEVRGVFDRMLATDEQIAEAQEFYNMEKSIIDLLDVPKEARQDADEKRKKSDKTAKEKLLAKYLKAFIKAEGGRKALEQIAKDEVDALPVYQAIDEATEAKISEADIIAIGGATALEEIKKNHPRIIAKDGDTSIGELALDFDFASPEVLVEELTKTRKKKDAIKEMTDSYIKAKETEILKDLSDRQAIEGTEELHNDEQLATLLADYQILLNQLPKDTKTKPHVIQQKVYRKVAKEALYSRPLNKAARYDLHAKTEKRYMKLAYKLASEGKLEEAAKAMNKQILNHIMVQEAVKIRDAKLKAEKFYKTKNLQNKLKNVEHDYMLVAADLLRKFDLNPSFQTAEETPNLGSIDEGLNDQLPEWVFTGYSPSGKTKWKEMTFEEFLALDETVKSILHAGKGALLSMQGTDLATVQQAIEESMKDMVQLDDATVLKQSKKISRIIKNMNLGRMWSEGIMLEYVYEELDNYRRHRTGEFGTMMKFQNRGREAEGDTKDIISQTMKLAEPHLKVIREAKQRLEEELGDNFFNIKGFPVPEILQEEGLDKWTAEKMIAFLLNTGNKHNYEVLQNAYNLTPNQVHKLSAYFTKAELAAIQGIWDVTNTLYEPLNATNFRMYNRNLPKVEAQAITLEAKDGTITLPGGYYPLSFDRSISDVAADQQENDLMKDRNKSVLRSQKPKDGVTKDRVGTAHSLPPLLSLSVWTAHINDTARFITHAEYLRDMARLTADKAWKKLARKKIGKNLYTQIRDNLKYQARPQRVFPSGVDKFLNWSRSMSTAVILGVNFGVGLKQRLSGLSAQQELGGTWIFKAAMGADLKGSILGMEKSDLWQEVSEKSKYIRAREGSMDREIHDVVSKLDPFIKRFKLDIFKDSNSEFLREGITAKDIRDSMFFLIQANDRAMTGIVWKAAYMKSMDSSAATLTQEQADKKAIQYADAIVTQTQPSSLPLDVNALQRSEGAARLFTMFMTWTFKQQNRFRHKYRAYKAGAITRKQYIQHITYEGLFASMGATMISSLLRGDLPEWWELMISPLEYSVAGIPGLRDVSGVIKYDNKLGQVSGLEGPNRILDAGISTYDVLKGDKEFTAFLWDMGRAAEAVSGVPAMTAAKNMKDFSLMLSGEGKKKKKKKKY